MESLGIETSLLIAQIVNFVVIMVVLKVLLYKPILTMLEERKKKIEEGLLLTQKMKEEEEKLNVKKEKVLADARNEARTIIEQAIVQAKKEEKEILGNARKSSDEIIEKGKKAALDEKKAMEGVIKKEAVNIAMHMAERLLCKSVSNDIAHNILDKHIKDIGKL